LAFGLTDVADARFEVSLLQWSTTGDDPQPMFTTYGSLIDNGSNDPMTVLPNFGTPYDVDCMWPPPEETTKAGTTGKAASRPLELPPVGGIARTTALNQR